MSSAALLMTSFASDRHRKPDAPLRPVSSEFSAVLSSSGLRLDCRAKSASGRILHWVRLMEANGYEVASSGGWYDCKSDAIQHAINRLPWSDVQA